MKRKIVFLDALPFDSAIQVGSQNYARLFRKRGHEVFSLASYLNMKRFARRSAEDRELIHNWRHGARVSPEGIHSYTPLCLVPYLRAPFLDHLAVAWNGLRYCWPDLRTILEKHGFLEIDLLFVNNIRLISILKLIKTKKILFRISDRIEGFHNVPRTIGGLQREVIRLADVNVATSQGLVKEAKRFSPKVFYLPNGVQKDFIKAGEAPSEYPMEFRSKKKPIVLYVGALNDWFDYDLYEYGLKKVPEASFVIIGPGHSAIAREKMQRFQKEYPNFSYLGGRLHRELKGYLDHADVGVIPFLVNDFTNEINPVKLFEYAARGLPAVATAMTELESYRDLVTLCKDKEDYVKALRFAAKQKPEISEKLMQKVQDHTWEKRFESMAHYLEMA